VSPESRSGPPEDRGPGHFGLPHGHSPIGLNSQEGESFLRAHSKPPPSPYFFFFFPPTTPPQFFFVVFFFQNAIAKIKTPVPVTLPEAVVKSATESSPWRARHTDTASLALGVTQISIAAAKWAAFIGKHPTVAQAQSRSRPQKNPQTSHRSRWISDFELMGQINLPPELPRRSSVYRSLNDHRPTKVFRPGVNVPGVRGLHNWVLPPGLPLFWPRDRW